MHALLHTLWQRLPAWEDTLANRVTLFRLILGTVVAHTLFGLGYCWEGTAAYTIAALLDFVDGWLARRTKCTEWGAFMDPVADKALVDSALFMIVRYFDYANWCFIPFVIVLTYDVSVMLMRFFDLKMKTSVTAKRKQAVLFAGVIALLVAVILEESVPLFEFAVYSVSLQVPIGMSGTTIGALMLWISTILILRSAWVYVTTYLLPRIWW